ncbi:nucleotide sugar dehydrogenase [Paenibacillus psychroresistens]|uniref:UDP-glucose 6-dehydrogenase n=1 Tax=Paenibacillus psychroresistens TaxID=1778678 RepID=A0A6B8RG45_9BACL|nr:nucleotide sugar dehydrogenase [Paenibacillus psychroresistens]QGQ94917.1 nucleotide sugar dehydrogenase [Paenibacillus psychroresistens]
MDRKKPKKMLTTLAVIDEIGKALEEKKPLSVVRVGDGENICLTQYNVWPIRKTLSTRWAILSRKTSWKGVRLPNLKLRDQLITAIKKADIVGVPYYNDKEILAEDQYLRPLTDTVFKKLNIQPKKLCYTFVNRHMVEHEEFWEMLKGKKAVVISRWANEFKKLVDKKYNDFNIKIVKLIQIYRFEEIPKVLDKMKSVDCDIVLISAGVNAVILAQKLADEQGRIAIDFGKSAVFMVKGNRKVVPYNPTNRIIRKEPIKRSEQTLKITVIGSGYVGTTTALVLASLGHEVIGYDIDSVKVENLNKGKLPFSEPGLDKLLQQQLKKAKITFTADSRAAIINSEILIISVGTPPTSDGGADLTYLQQVIDVIAEHINKPKIIVTKSTVPIGTNRWMKAQLSEKIDTRKYPIEVISNPEFLREGEALHDSLHPSRTVIGGDAGPAIEKMKQVYAPLKTSYFICNYETAEMIKYASNGFLATKISFINEIARLAELVGADIEKVAAGMGLDPRISPHHLHAGIGYGGSCFPKDVDELLYLAEQNKLDLSLLKQAKRINNSQIAWFIQKIQSDIPLKGKKVLVLGVAFKEDTDDQRESPGVRLIEHLIKLGVKEIKVVDPTITTVEQIRWTKPFQARNNLKIEVTTNPKEAITGVHAVILTTPWPIFATYPWQEWVKKTETPYLFDGRNFLDPQKMRSYGWKYSGIARGDET